MKRLARYLAVAPANQAYSRLESRSGMPLYVLRHPVDGFSQFKRRHIGSWSLAAVIVFLWLVASVTEYYGTGFAFAINRNVDFNMAIRVAVTVGVFAAFVLSNWIVSIILDGNGSLKDITATAACSLIPISCLLFRRLA